MNSTQAAAQPASPPADSQEQPPEYAQPPLESMDRATSPSDHPTHTLRSPRPPSDDSLHHADGDDEATRLAHLSATVRNQDDLEKAVGHQADQALLQQADERDEKRLQRAVRDKDKLDRELASVRKRLDSNPHMAQRLQTDMKVLEENIKTLEDDCQQIKRRMKQRHEDVGVAAQAADQSGNQRRPGESQRDFLIRTGKITPFARMGELSKPSDKLVDVMMDAEKGTLDEGEDGDLAEEAASQEYLSHRNLARPGFEEAASRSVSGSPVASIDRPARKKRRLRRSSPGPTRTHSTEASEDDYLPELGEDSESDGPGFIGQETDEQLSRRSKHTRGRRASMSDAGAKEDLADVDDGNENLYQTRLKKWETGRRAARARAVDGSASPHVSEPRENTAQEHEHLLPHPTRGDEVFDGGLRVPGDIYPSLFDYQKTSVRWLWELYQQQAGGIIGDEMGLGKTIQVISFLAALHHSDRYEKPIIVVCPATIMKQWVSEFHRWWPPFRVSILHTSGSGMMDLRRESKIDEDLDMDRFDGASPRTRTSNKAAKRIVDRVCREGHVLVTTYSGLQTYAQELVPIQWGYAVLDEGHKIRNPNTSVTMYCKELRTSNRIILSGTPMQNNLTELWSLFDFVFPMRLGTLINFRDTFEIPIKQGGYANASNLQVETAYNCAEALKDTISPYLLQRWKSDVASDLPAKSEQVLFCKLTKQQSSAYELYLDSPDHKAVEAGKRQPLYSIDNLRKICNHPDLQDHRHLSVLPGYNYGAGYKSGKMQVVKALLQLWKDTGHKTLLFAQHRIMLDILETFIKSMDGIRYCRMDGNTAIKDRQSMVNDFNNDSDLHVFLLTTRVGGLGVNLVGADRVIIYDPDWNPSTDVQARERAWRLGQKREVMIFRLMTAGTIEEKIYHRQLFKQFLTNKILRDPKQRQTFHLQGLHDLFTLGPTDGEQTETGGLFEGSERRIEHIPSTEPKSNDDAQISSIVGIDRRETLQERAKQTGNQSSTDDGPKDGSDGDQNHFMETLLGGAGVHASLSHDAIIDQSSQKRKITADPVMITKEAKRVAAEAAAQLRRAQEVARDVPIGTPTWTGQYGIAGRPDELASRSVRGGNRGGLGRGGGAGGPSSSAVLANLAARQAGQQSRDGDSPAPNHPRGVDFMTRIRDFMKAHDGRVYTQMLIDHFNQYCTTAQRSADFKEMLRTIADLEQPTEMRGAGRSRRGGVPGRAGRGGRGLWVLKKEFGGPGGGE